MTAYSGTLGTSPAALGDGSHALDVVVADAAGESTTTPIKVKVDAHAPVAVALKPSGTDHRPAAGRGVLGRSRARAASARSRRALDGAPMQITGADATFTPAADLGLRRAHRHLPRHRRGRQQPRRLVDVRRRRHDAAVALARRRRPTARAARTAGPRSPSTWPTRASASTRPPPRRARRRRRRGRRHPRRRALLAHPGRDLAYGIAPRQGHRRRPLGQRDGAGRVDVRASPTSTAPVLSDPTPEDGSSGADRTPAISFADRRRGHRRRPRRDRAVASTATTSPRAARFADGRFSLPPGGCRSASASTRSRRARPTGRATPLRALTWSFTVRRRAAARPSPAQRPLPGSIVPGATVDRVRHVGRGHRRRGRHAPGRRRRLRRRVLGHASRQATSPTRPGTSAPACTRSPSRWPTTPAMSPGPVMWQFAVADPASLGLAAARRPRVDRGRRTPRRSRSPPPSNGAGMAGARVLVSARPAGNAAFGPARIVTASRQRAGRVLGLAGAHDRLPGRARGRPSVPDRAHARRAPARDAGSLAHADAPRRRAPADAAACCPGRGGRVVDRSS